VYLQQAELEKGLFNGQTIRQLQGAAMLDWITRQLDQGDPEGMSVLA
jgi:hypothetical protein